jgi:protein-tyrosine phosphatase
MSGYWDRDLARDLDVMREWGATAVITLLEMHEMTLLRVERLGEEIARRNMRWLHLPITDVSVPKAAFEEKWLDAGAELRSLLCSGHDVIVPWRGCLGRAGTTAARLLVERGVEPDKAIAAVRAVRPGAIETNDREKVCRRDRRGPKMVVGSNPWTGLKDLRDFVRRTRRCPRQTEGRGQPTAFSDQRKKLWHLQPEQLADGHTAQH